MFTRALALLIGLPTLLVVWPATASADSAHGPRGHASRDQHRLADPVDPARPGADPDPRPDHQPRRRGLGGDQPLPVHLQHPDDDPSRAGGGRRACPRPSTSATGSPTSTTRSKSSQPGASRTFSITVPRSLISAEISGAAGVYWFGVHASGESIETPRDEFTDGRARTFLPLVPESTRGAVRTSLVVPLRRFLGREPDGSLSDADAWQRSLSDDGRLREAVQFAAAAGPGQISWLVDPALLDAVRRLAAGNPARSLGPTIEPTDPGETPSESPTEEPDEERDRGRGARHSRAADRRRLARRARAAAPHPSAAHASVRRPRHRRRRRPRPRSDRARRDPGERRPGGMGDHRHPGDRLPERLPRRRHHRCERPSRRRC